MEVKAKILNASARISAILAELERDSGEKVSSIELCSVEVTTMTDKHRRQRTSVVIHFETPYTREWD